MATGLLQHIKSLFDGDPGVRKVADDPVLSAELLLLFRMILADGAVKDSELDMLRRICREAFPFRCMPCNVRKLFIPMLLDF